MHRFAGLIVATALAMTSGASAQPASNPVMENYRAYNTALQRGDLAAAETAAVAALAASEARDGDGGRTPVLVTNLAQVRISAARYNDALAPAQRSLAFAQAGVEGLDVLSARILVGQAELGRGGRGAAERLQATLEEARAAGGRESQVYLAASRLGSWAIAERFHVHGVAAYTLALNMTTLGDPNGVPARAAALIGRGTARMLGDQVGFVEGATGTHFVESPEGLAELDYAEALRILRPLAQAPTNGTTFTESQQLYVSALGWSVALRARLRSLGWEDPAPLANGGSLYVMLPPFAPLCRDTLQAPSPVYPGSAVNNFGVGSVVVRIVVDQSGAIVERGVVATAGGDAFRTSVERVLPRWRYEPSSETVQPCSRASVRFIPYLFLIGREGD